MSAQPADPARGSVPLDAALRWVSMPRAGGKVEEAEDGLPLAVDVTELAPADLAEHGVSLRPHARAGEARATARVWLTHSEVSVRYPKEDRAARATAREAASFWWRRKRTLKGLRIHRSFPCLGKFRVVNEGAESGPVLVVCEVCGDLWGVDRGEFEKALTDSLK